jgi:hypothetical protein
MTEAVGQTDRQTHIVKAEDAILQPFIGTRQMNTAQEQIITPLN